ncbi:class I SAM-dependent methyltransferase [Rudaeicoccus suwonensis]|uniref:Cyclopropane-fatty-acyl-phospholipid synthase n=1 Tax=Rudaeicoccus suwonensis TaxID=657409 RepID=A0A561E0Z7_9MICO|nr:class I SAM-dependent methyltransferase [Rudaeicoccus suwonensis]TWE09316.1 cyclopropane-fatty-acyl-phospholipid synthase [Rudaeicoccus suwonensis]
MTTATPQPRLTIDPVRWPDVAHVPHGARARIGSIVAGRIFRYAVSRMSIRVMMPDGSILGAGNSDEAPLMRVHSPESLLRRIGTDGLIGFGEAYQAGDWDCDDLAALITEFATHVEELVPRPLRRLRATYGSAAPRSDRPQPENSRTNVERHYDLSNDMFSTFLDPTMTYSSALYADDDESLVSAQERKIDRLLYQAEASAGTSVLEIGSGWGSLALRAARRGATVDSVTLSSQQEKWANKLLAHEGVADKARVRICDYRDVDGRYDAVVSVEMIEAVGLEFLDAYFERIARSLKSGGRAAIQAITMSHHRVQATRNEYTWIHKYIFPGGALPSIEMLRTSAARVGLELIDDLAMGDSYARTLDAWANEFDRHTTQLDRLGFDETFRRMWHFYLRYSQGGFTSGYLNVHQLTFVNNGMAA